MIIIVKSAYSELSKGEEVFSAINVLTKAFPNATSGIKVFTESLSTATGASGVLKGAISGLWTVISAHPILTAVAAIGIMAVAFDHLYESAEEANEKMENSFEAYETAKNKVNDINTELESTNSAIDTLLAKDSLTFIEEGELEKLKQTTEQLQIQADLAEKEALKKGREAADDALNAYRKNFKDEISAKKIQEYQDNANITMNNLGLSADEKDISAMLAYIRQTKSQKEEVWKELVELNSQKEELDAIPSDQLTKDQVKELKSLNNEIEWTKEEWQSCDDTIKSSTDSVWEQVSALNDYKSKFESIPYDELTQDQKNALTEINDAIETVYKELDPSKWKQIQFDKIFNDKSFANAKKELIDMASASENLGITVEDVKNEFQELYPSLETALKDKGFTMDDFVAQINAEAEIKNIDVVTEQILEKFEESVTESVDEASESIDTESEVEVDIDVEANTNTNTPSLVEFQEFIDTLTDQEKLIVYDLVVNSDIKSYSIDELREYIETAKSGEQEIKSFAQTIDGFYEILNDTEEGGFSKSLDAYTDKLDTLKDSLEKFNEGDLTESDITTLIRQFPQLINYADNMGEGIQSLIDEIINVGDSSTGAESLVDFFADAIVKLGGESTEAGAAMAKLRDQILDFYSAANNGGIKIDIDAETSKFSNMYTAAKNSRSGTGLTNDDISNIKAMYSSLSSYDPSKLFERTEHGIHLNTKSLRELEAEYEKVNKNEISSKLRELRTEMNGLTDADVAQKEKLQAQIDSLEILQSQYEGLTSSYNKWIQAQASGNERDMYENIGSGKDTIQDLIDRGWVGSEEVRDYVDLISGKDLSTAPIEDILKAWQEVNSTIEGTDYTAFDFFTKDANGNSTTDGIYNFFDAVNKTLGDGYAKIEDVVDENGDVIGQAYSFDFSDGKGAEVAEKLGLDAEYIQSILRAAIDAGFDVDMNSAWEQDLDQVIETVEDKRQELEDLGTEPIEINLDVQAGADGDTSAITAEIEKVTAEIERINETPVELRTEADTANLEYYNEALNVLIQKKIEAEQPAYMSIDASSATASMKECLEAIQNYKQAENELNALKLNPSADTTQIAAAEEKVKAAAEAIQGLPTEAKTKIGIEGEDSVDTIIEKMKDLDPETEIFLSVDAGDSVSSATELKETIDGIEGKTIDITVNVTGLDEVNALKEAVDGLSGNTVNATAEVSGKGEVDALKGAIDALYARTVQEKANVSGTSETQALKSAIDSLYSKTVQARANVYGTSEVHALKSAIDSLYSKTVTTTHITNNITNNKTTNSANGTANTYIYGTANASGTAFADGSNHTNVAGGDWRIGFNGVSLGGEEDPELLVRDGKFYVIGENGAEFFRHEANDIIFNADQTKQLLENGRIGHGKRRGKSFANGTAFADASTGAGVRYNRTTTSSWTPTSQSNYTPGSTYKQTKDTSNNTKGETAFDKFKNWLDKLFDWVEVKLERQTRKIEKYTARADAALEANSYGSAASNYVNAIGATATQIANNEKGAAKYKSTADQVLSNAVGKGIISKKGAKSIAKQVADGTINIKSYSKNVQEVIKAYKDWYDKSLDCADAVETLHQNIRKYVQSLKDVRDAQRDTTLEAIDLYSTIGTSGFTSTSGAYYGFANSQLSYANTQLGKQNEAYQTEVTNVTADATSLGKSGKSAINSQLKNVNSTISNKTKNYKEKRKAYKKALNNALAAIKAKKAISASDLKIIKKYSTSTYEKLYAYNLQLENVEAAKLEQATAYAANSSDIFKNTAEKYSNKDRATNNKMDLNRAKASNASSVKKSNEYLAKVAAGYDDILADDRAEIAEYGKEVTNNQKIINKSNGSNKPHRGNNYSKLSKTGKSNVDKYIDKAQAAAKSGKSISAAIIAKLAQYYSKGYITLAFYQACVDYNNALEYKHEAEAQYAIDQETAKQEKAAIGQQMLDNVIQKYSNKENTNAAKTTAIQTAQSLKQARGLSLTKGDYKNLIKQSQKDAQIYSDAATAISAQIQQNLASGYWTTDSQEYKDALITLADYQNRVNQCAVDQQEWNNAIANLPYKKLEDALELLDAIRDNYKSLLSINLAKGIAETASQYRQEIANTNSEISKYTKLRQQAWNDYLKASQDPDGVYGGKTADEWLKEYYQYDTQVNNLRKDVVELNNAIANLPYDTIEKALNSLKSTAAFSKSVSDLKKAQGYDLSASDYNSQIFGNNSQISKLEQERSQAYQDYLKALSDADGVYGGKTKEEWLTLYNDLGSQINNLKIDNEQLKDALRDDVYWRTYERAHAAAKRYADVLSGIKDLIDDEMYFDKDGKLTKYGIAQIANLTSEYENARKEVSNYSNDIKNLNNLYAQGYYTEEEYKEKLGELQASLMDSASDMKSAIREIKDMYKDMAESELDNLFKLIDARNDALSAKKAYYDYDKTISNKTKDIQSLQAQIAALDGVAGAEAKAKRATLEAQLAEAQQDLDDTITDHMFDLSQDSLNDMKNTLKEAFDDKWDEMFSNLQDISSLMAAANSLTASSTATINSTLNELLRFYGIDPVSTGVKSTVGYASGTKKTNKDENAWINEYGTELLVSPTDNAIMAGLKKGTGVIPAGFTDNLFDWGEIDPSHFINSMVGKLNNRSTNGVGNVINQHYDSLLNVEGNVDSTVVTDMQEFAKTFYKGAYEYSVREIVRDARKVGIKA